MRVLLLYAHPSPTSFCHLLLETAVAALEHAGHDVDVIDLHGIGFNPILSEHEWRNHHLGVTERDADVAGHAARIQAVEALVLIHPTWWGGHPAILKGWFDRVLCEGVAYDLAAGQSEPHPRLQRIRRVVVITTHGSPRRVNRLQGEPGRHFVNAGLRSVMHRRCDVRVHALYGLDSNTVTERQAFLAGIEQLLGPDFERPPTRLSRLRTRRRPLRLPLGPLTRLRD